MIRRDYILRMLAEFFEVLSRIRALQKGQKWTEARLLTDQQFQRLVGGDAQATVQLSETELLARLIKSESTLAVREKTLILSTLLKEAGDLAASQDRLDESRLFHLKGLHLLLGVLSREGGADFPEFVPSIEGFLAALGGSSLPLATQAMLMQYFEAKGEFARAEDELFSMIDDHPDAAELVDFGRSFYQRLQTKSDDALVAGNLPRAELKSGLEQLAKIKANQGSALATNGRRTGTS